MAFNSVTVAADNYNLENEGRSWFDASAMAVGATVVGAVNGAMNSVGHILNAVGVNDDYNPVDTYDRLSAMGMEDTAAFYGEHRQGLDIASLLAGSIVPGTAGMKAFQALGNSGKIRSALYLKQSRLEELRKEANNAAELGKTLWNPLHGKAAKATAYGFGLNAMETLAFETAALATTIASPIYSEMDSWDMFKNTVAMGALGGFIGGTFSGAKTYFGVKAAVRDAALSQPISKGLVAGTPEYVNLLRTKASDAPEVVINQTVRKMAGDDAGLMLSLQNIVKEQSFQDTATVFDKASGMKRLSTLAAEDAAAAMKAAAKQETAELAPRQFLELETKRIYSSADSAVIKQLGNVGDFMPANGSLDSAFVRRGFIAVRNETGKVIDELKVPLGKPLLDMTVQESQVARIAAAELPISPVGISSDNIIEMEKWLQQSAFGTPVDGIAYTSVEPVQALLRVKKQEVFGKLLANGTAPEAATKIVNIPASHKLDDALWEVPLLDMKDAASKPRFAAITYDQAALDADRTANVYAAEALQQAEEIAANERMNNYLTTSRLFGQLGLPEVGGSLVPPDDVAKMLNTASKASETAGAFSFANASYGTITAWAQNMGKIVNRTVQKLTAETNEQLAKSLEPIKADLKLADNLAMAVNKLRGTSEHYVIMQAPNGGKQLVRMDVAEEIASLGKAARKQGLDEAKNPEIISGLQKEVLDFLELHSSINLQKYRKPNSAIATTNGSFDVKLHERYPELMPVYVPNVNLQKYNHFLLVRQDPKVFGASSHTSVIVAKDAADLDAKRRRVEAAIQEQEGAGGLLRWQFISKAESKDYHEALGDYNYNRGLNSSRVDNTLRRAGVLSEAQPTLPSQNIAALDDMIDDFRSWHGRMTGGTVRNMVESGYGEVFMQLRMMGDDLLEYETSRAAKLGAGATKKIANPYNDITKTALDISKFDEYRPWAMLNELTEQVGTKAIAAIGNSYDTFLDAIGKGKVKRIENMDAYVDDINKTAEAMGIQLGYKRAAEHVLKDEIAQSPMLSRSISRAQGILSGYVLGIDVIQHFNNAVGLFVLQNAEIASIVNGIAKKDASIVGNLMQIKMPGSDKTFMATAKLNAGAIKRFFQGGEVWDAEAGGWVKKTGSELAAEYEQRGLSMTQLQQFRTVVDNLTFTGTEGSAELGGKLLKSAEGVAEFGRKWTGGNWTEKFTRFVAADAMRQITDHGLAQGVLKTQAEAEVFWNTAVNRIQGNMLASQRPMVMQGPVGQAIGLFMTYQVNLMQQLFRYVGTGDKVATGMLMGTQVSLYGMQGLPGWNFLNTHLIGNASGNRTHADMYVAANKMLPDEVADWVLYGAGSNMLGAISPELKFNLYSRGDLNPRQLTIFPTEVDNTVLYKATTSFIGNLIDSTQNLANGAPVGQTFYQALQHNGVNRMLAGVGTVLAGGQYTSDGKLITPFDEQLGLLNAATWVRIAGAKPLNDALAADALFRNRAYDAKDTDNIKKLSEAVRLDAADGSFDPEQLESFAGSYVKSGGNLKNFNNFLVRKLKDQQQTVVEQAVGQLKGERLQNYMAIIGADSPTFEFERRSFEGQMGEGD